MDIQLETVRCILDLYLLKRQIPDQDVKVSLQKVISSGKMRHPIKNLKLDETLCIDDIDTLLRFRYAIACPEEPSQALLKKMHLVASLSILLNSYISGHLETNEFYQRYKALVKEGWDEDADTEFISVLFDMSYAFALSDVGDGSNDWLDRTDIVYLCVKAIERLSSYWKFLVG